MYNDHHLKSMNLVLILVNFQRHLNLKDALLLTLFLCCFRASWFTVFLIQILVIAILVLIIVAAFKFFANANLFLFFVLIVVYGFSMVGIACLMASFFDNALVSVIMLYTVQWNLCTPDFLGARTRGECKRVLNTSRGNP